MVEFPEGIRFEELDEKQLRYLSYQLVRRWKALRAEIEEELEFNQSLVRISKKHWDVISRDAKLKRSYESLRATALKKIPELEGMLDRMKRDDADVLQTAQAARRRLKEIRENSKA